MKPSGRDLRRPRPFRLGGEQETVVEDSKVKPTINKRKCPAQRDICKAIAACPRGAIGYVEDAQEPLGGKIFFDYDKCDACGQCVTECCGAAIEMCRG